MITTAVSIFIIGLFWTLSFYTRQPLDAAKNQFFYLIPITIACIGAWEALHKRLYAIAGALTMYAVSTFFWAITYLQILTVSNIFILYTLLFFCIYPLLAVGYYHYVSSLHPSYTRNAIIMGVVVYCILTTTVLLLISGVVNIPKFPNTTNLITYIVMVIALLVDAAFISFSLTAMNTRWSEANTRTILLLFSISFILWAAADTTLTIRQIKGISWPGDISDTLYMVSLFILTMSCIRIPIPDSATPLE